MFVHLSGDDLKPKKKGGTADSSAKICELMIFIVYLLTFVPTGIIK